MSVALKPRQRMIWLENQLTPTLPVNCEVCYLSIQGNLDIPTLKHACQQLFQRHDALRAQLVNIDGEAVPRMCFPKTIEPDVRTMQIGVGTLRDNLAELSNTSFGLNECLSRVIILSEGSDLHHVVVIQSHLIMDGGTVILLFRDVEQIYNSAYSDLAPPAWNATPYEQILRQAAALPENVEADVFWNDLLRSRPPAVKLYGTPAKSFRGRVRRVERSISDPLRQAIESRQAQVSPAQALTIATAVTIYRTTGEGNIGLGVPVLNRTPSMMDVAGLCMEVLPNRFDLDASQTLSDLGKQLTEYTRLTKPYRGHTISTSQSGHDVSVNFYPPRPSTFAGHPAKATFTTALEFIDADPIAANGGTQLGLTILAFGSGQGPKEIIFDFDTGRWPDFDLQDRFADHLMTVLSMLIDDPHAAIGAIDILSESERSTALALPDRWHSLPSDLPSVTQMISDVAADDPDQIAVVFEGDTLTYGELMARAESIARGIVANGAGPGSLIALCVTRSLDLPAILLGVMLSGASYLPLDPRHPASRLATIIEDADPALLMSDNTLDVSDIITSDKTVYMPDLLGHGPETGSLPDIGALAYVIFTSGSTGRPKGVCVPHHALSAFLIAMKEIHNVTPSDRLLAVTTIAFDIAALELFLPLVSGGAVHIAPYEASVDAAKLSSMMRDDAITIFQATPVTYRLLLAAGWEGPNVRALCGGEALPTDLARRIIDSCASLWNMYGPTETTIWSSFEQVTKDSLPVTIGNPIPGTRLSIRTVLGTLCPPGVPGELNISGQGVTSGYYERPELTAEKFVLDTDGSDRERRYRTGDVARLLPDGRVEFIGRIDFQVKVRGFRIELGEIEAQIGQVNGVDSTAVITFSDVSGETALAAYYTGCALPDTKKAIQAQLMSELPTYMRPAVLEHIDQMPLTPAGKTDRKALPDPSTIVLTDNDTPMTVIFANDLERGVAEAWETVLKCKNIGPDANFFDLGGHSILAMQLVLELEQTTGVELDLGAIFSSPTVAEMAARIQNGAEQLPSALISFCKDGDRDPLFCICGIEIYRALAEMLGTDRPIYGLYVEEEAEFLRTATSGKIADVSIGKLAEAYAAAIIRQRPDRPVQLLGVSFGGVLALETARILEEANITVSNVIMLDTIRRDGRRTVPLRYAAAKVRKLFQGDFSKVASGLVRKVKKRINDNTAKYVTISEGDESSPERLREIAFIKAMEAHDASISLTASVLLVKAADRSIWGDGIVFDEDYGWSAALGKPVNVLEVDGDHLSILREPAVHALAASLLPKLS